MSKLKLVFAAREANHQQPIERIGFYCPGCNDLHYIAIGPWNWNGDRMMPTFNPSILCNPQDDSIRCHLFVAAGQIRFLVDCHHQLKGMTVPVPEIPEQFKSEGYGENA